MEYAKLFDIDFEAGTLTWRTRPLEHFKTERAWKAFNTRDAGKVAGGFDSEGYRVIKINGKSHKAHRIIYESVYGPLKSGENIDHIDGHPANNAINNLRVATNAENSRNRGAQRTNKTGLKGVSFHYGKHRAVIIDGNGKQIELGRFATKGLAALAYAKASIREHGRFSPFLRP